jgi:hypothetical protein
MHNRTVPEQSIRNRDPVPAVDAAGASARASRPAHGASRAAATAIAALVVLACLARVAFPNSDPSMPTWIGYVVDEGRWNQSARSLALFGTMDDTAVSRLHLFLAPGYQAVNFVLFKILGIDFWSARAFSAVAGIALVVVPVLVLRRLVSPLALALGVVLLGFEGNLLAASRLAFPEIPAALGTLLAFLLLVRGGKTRWNAFAAGSLAAVAVAMKATTVLVVPIFPLIVLLSAREGRVAERVARALAFVAGFAIWVVGGLAFALAFGLMTPDAVLFSSSRLVTYLSLTGPYITVMRFFESTDLEARNLLLLGAWLGSWAWWYRDRRAPAGLCEFYLASGAWALWWLVAWSGSNYLPGRYVIHFVVPATIHVVAGVALLRRDLPDAIATAMHQGRGWRRALALGWLVVPTAVLLAALGAGWLDRVEVDSSRLAARIGTIVIAALVLGLVVRRGCDRPLVVAWLLAFPFVFVALWLAGRELGGLEHFWQPATAMDPPLVLGLVTLAALVAAVLARLASKEQGRPLLAIGAVAMLGGVLLLQSAPALLAPTYSVRDASLDLGRRLATATQVRNFSAESMFLANRVRYRTLQSTDRGYDALVIFEHGAQSARFLGSGRAGGLERVMTYPILHHPRYRTQESLFGPASVALFVRPR